MKWLVIILASILSSIFYRLGGTSRGTLWRDIGCSIITCLMLGYLITWHWTLVLVFGLTWGALSTYNKWAKVEWLFWLITGVFYSLAVFPFIFVTGHWIGFGIRTVVLGLSTMIWRLSIGNAVLEELGVGFLFCATIPLLLI